MSKNLKIAISQKGSRFRFGGVWQNDRRYMYFHPKWVPEREYFFVKKMFQGQCDLLSLSSKL